MSGAVPVTTIDLFKAERGKRLFLGELSCVTCHSLEDYIGSDLETMEVASGLRRIIYTAADSFQAPNWTKDGKALIFNRNGRLYRLDLKAKRPTVIDTGFATNNNNDHVLSFDGRMIAISNHSRDDGNASIIYTLPVNGGVPRRVTAKGPSYLHGWSPDVRYLQDPISRR